MADAKSSVSVLLGKPTRSSLSSVDDLAAYVEWWRRSAPAAGWRHILTSTLLALSAACGGLTSATNASLAAPPFLQDERGVQAGLVEVRRSRLGVSLQDLTVDIAAAAGLSEGKGVVITRVEPGSPAASAGIRPGDVILAVNRRAVPSASALRNDIGSIEIGSAVELTIWRDGERRTIRTWLAKPGRSRGPYAGPNA